MQIEHFTIACLGFFWSYYVLHTELKAPLQGSTLIFLFRNTCAPNLNLEAPTDQ